MTKILFQKQSYHLIITDHARSRMIIRGISEDDLIKVIETGEIKPKKEKGRFWVYKSFKERKDNYICASLKIEKPHLLVITALINWRPK